MYLIGLLHLRVCHYVFFLAVVHMEVVEMFLCTSALYLDRWWI
jgi:hypothetical protein